jgi:hypothetical protein
MDTFAFGFGPLVRRFPLPGAQRTFTAKLLPMPGAYHLNSLFYKELRNIGCLILAE